MAADERVKKYCGDIEELCLNDPGNRCILHLRQSLGSLFDAANSLLLNAEDVVILTGFSVPPAETDGPPGCAAICIALSNFSRNISIRVVTDSTNKMAVHAALEAAGVEDRVELIVAPVGVNVMSETTVWNRVWKGNVTHVVSIERVGPSSDGKLYNMRGIDVSSHHANIHTIMEVANDRGLTTICIGDGGNELGMGNRVNEVKLYIKNGEQIACVVPCKHLLVAGVSNWGGMALAASMELLSRLYKLMHNDNLMAKLCFVDPECDWNVWHTSVTEQCMRAGAVDGVSREQWPCSPSVDGFGTADPQHTAVLEGIKMVSVECLEGITACTL